jgi:sulfopyruvate decarboxylase TPP-binding subunit
VGARDEEEEEEKSADVPRVSVARREEGAGVLLGSGASGHSSRHAVMVACSSGLLGSLKAVTSCSAAR